MSNEDGKALNTFINENHKSVHYFCAVFLASSSMVFWRFLDWECIENNLRIIELIGIIILSSSAFCAFKIISAIPEYFYIEGKLIYPDHYQKTDTEINEDIRANQKERKRLADKCLKIYIPRRKWLSIFGFTIIIGLKIFIEMGK